MHKEQHFGIYSNTDINNGSPYSQLILLHKISKSVFKDKEKYARVEYDELDLNQYLPYLKDRRISLPPPLWNRPRLMVDKTEGDYRQSFRVEEHATYFELLGKELNQASSNIYFLGYPPSSDYTGHEAAIVKAYYDTHVKLIAREPDGVNIHRFILNPYGIQGDFLEYLKSLLRFNQEGAAPRFKLFVSDEIIPLDSDLILIDPDTANASSISSYLRERRTAPGKIPIRLEVIKENASILRHKLDFCLAFKGMRSVKEYRTVVELEAFLDKLVSD